MVNYMDRQVLSVVLQPMKIDLDLTDAQAGWADSPTRWADAEVGTGRCIGLTGE